MTTLPKPATKADPRLNMQLDEDIKALGDNFKNLVKIAQVPPLFFFFFLFSFNLSTI